MGGLGGHYAKCNKSDSERQILCNITYMWNLKKYNKLVKITKKKQTHRYRKQTGGCQREGVLGRQVKYMKRLKRYRLPVIKINVMGR